MEDCQLIERFVELSDVSKDVVGSESYIIEFDLHGRLSTDGDV